MPENFTHTVLLLDQDYSEPISCAMLKLSFLAICSQNRCYTMLHATSPKGIRCSFIVLDNRSVSFILNLSSPNGTINNATAIDACTCACVCITRNNCLCSWLLSASLFFHENYELHIYDLLRLTNKMRCRDAHRHQRNANSATE